MAGPLDQIVPVTITASGATPQIANSNTPTILCYHTHNADYIRTYTSLAAALAELPGVNRADINVEVVDGYLTINAARKTPETIRSRNT